MHSEIIIFATVYPNDKAGKKLTWSLSEASTSLMLKWKKKCFES